ncbi:MAG: hypothetical protein H6Q10_3414, partial [Acidobacteria bacterium]|nr:hypothetical protein [Acidobacteriota bacterium]
MAQPSDGRRSFVLLPRTRRGRLGLALGAAALALGAAASWWILAGRGVTSTGGVDLGSLPPGVSRDGLNLVVVTLDTTRADRFGAYGARDIETPAVDALAREGVLFEQAVAVAPLTLPVHCSLFTGKFPPEHGVRDNGGFFLGPEQVTLAELLKARGYRTGGFIGAYVLDSKWGIDQGFDTYFDDFDLGKSRVMSVGSIQRPGNEVVDKALPWIDEAARGGRFFAWVHLYDPHTPYRPPEPFASRYKGRPYNGEVAFADSQVGRVVRRLKELGVYDRTVIVVMGDHGESLGDHGEATHGFFIYNSVTHVPFVIRAPFSRTGSRRVADPVRSVDLAHRARPARRGSPEGGVGREPGPPDDGVAARAGPRRLLRVDVPPAPLRLVRHPCAARRALQGDRRAAARALRRGSRPPGGDEPVRPAPGDRGRHARAAPPAGGRVH